MPPTPDPTMALNMDPNMDIRKTKQKQILLKSCVNHSNVTLLSDIKYRKSDVKFHSSDVKINKSDVKYCRCDVK